MNKTYDAIVVGGGVNGGAIAYNLAKRGMEVLLLEKDRLVSKASGAAAGMLGAQAELDGKGPLFQLARASRTMFSNLADELKMASGIDIELVNKGMLRLALTDDEQQEYHRIIEAHRQNGELAEWLTGEEVRKREPALSSEIIGAMYLEKDGQVAAHQLALGFLKSASALGSVIKEYVEVHSFHFSNGKITGIATNEGDFLSDSVVVTGGAWSEKLLMETGLQLKTYPVKGECFSVRTEASLLSSTIFTNDCYLVPKKGGRIIVGATVIPNTFNQQVTVEGVSLLMENAKKLVPSIAQAEWEGAWAGIRPQTADGLPYLGEHPGYRGLFIATGHFRNGILLAPITGEVMADLVEGKSPPIDISSFRVDRSIRKTNLIMR
ncbi:glycine oxidase ThiO [Planococcus antarcticus DSM 14505]|uniref:glycine oxidase n=1 Tax=Planococcus antarcticus DSM 14505 TaxID=1185653 RepID=A0ABM6D344_9BACL|nr:glycine oxidase ThiO [Planococcus antarcticus]ANU09648.1 glycine oxidase ThiO [Planococcus antarcticus DSM 14505]